MRIVYHIFFVLFLVPSYIHPMLSKVNFSLESLDTNIFNQISYASDNTFCKNSAEYFLSHIPRYSFSNIMERFNDLPEAAQVKTCCYLRAKENKILRDICCFGAMNKDIRLSVARCLFNNNDMVTQKFCSVPIYDALKKYQEALYNMKYCPIRIVKNNNYYWLQEEHYYVLTNEEIRLFYDAFSRHVVAPDKAVKFKESIQKLYRIENNEGFFALEIADTIKLELTWRQIGSLLKNEIFHSLTILMFLSKGYSLMLEEDIFADKKMLLPGKPFFLRTNNLGKIFTINTVTILLGFFLFGGFNFMIEKIKLQMQQPSLMQFLLTNSSF